MVTSPKSAHRNSEKLCRPLIILIYQREVDVKLETNIKNTQKTNRKTTEKHIEIQKRSKHSDPKECILMEC